MINKFCSRHGSKSKRKGSGKGWKEDGLKGGQAVTELQEERELWHLHLQGLEAGASRHEGLQQGQ